MVEISRLLAATDEEAVAASGTATIDFAESIANSVYVGNTNEA